MRESASHWTLVALRRIAITPHGKARYRRQ
jgi:hypothetical protein